MHEMTQAFWPATKKAKINKHALKIVKNSIFSINLKINVPEKALKREYQKQSAENAHYNIFKRRKSMQHKSSKTA